MVVVYYYIGIIISWLASRFRLGSWNNTLNQVIATYSMIKRNHPGLSDWELFVAVLDVRYSLPRSGAGGVREEMYHSKEECKEVFSDYVEQGVGRLRYNLPGLILCCLVIEKQSFFFNYPRDLVMGMIELEVARQGY